MLKRLVLCLIMTISLSACEFTKSMLATETAPPLASEPAPPAAGETTPLAEDTVKAPVLSLPNEAPLPTVAPEFTDNGCRAGEVLAGIRKDFPYQVAGKKPLFASNYFIFQEMRAIVVWFQDASLKAGTPESDLAKTAEKARLHASQVTAALLARDACIKQLFSVLDVIVVDEADNGWFSGEVALDKAPAVQSGAGSTAQADEVKAISEAFDGIFLRSKPIPPLGEKSKCTFAEARTKILSHFSDGKTPSANLEFYRIVDEGAGTIYAQWSGDAIAANNLARIMNVALELQCLTVPKIDAILFTVVDKQGRVVAAGRMPGESIASLDVSKIEYQAVQ